MDRVPHCELGVSWLHDGCLLVASRGTPHCGTARSPIPAPTPPSPGGGKPRGWGWGGAHRR
eukprot:2708032-Alexandrium_andersonii.AAC.1